MLHKTENVAGTNTLAYFGVATTPTNRVAFKRIYVLPAENEGISLESILNFTCVFLVTLIHLTFI
jgi:hypothetical protein